MPNFHQQVTFKSPSSSVDAYGQETGAETTVAVRRATVRQMSGRELAAASQLYPSANWKVICRYDTALLGSETWNITYGSRVLEIGNINNVDERNRLLEFLCSEVQ
jgi:SPP1 family predicted phage head-tail adaptor